MPKHDKKSAGRIGGLATVKKYGPEHMAEIGKAGAKTTWTRYHLQPTGTSDFAMINRETGQIVALISGRRP